MLGFCQSWIFGQKFDFSNSVLLQLLLLFSTQEIDQFICCCNNHWKLLMLYSTVMPIWWRASIDRTQGRNQRKIVQFIFQTLEFSCSEKNDGNNSFKQDWKLLEPSLTTQKIFFFEVDTFCSGDYLLCDQEWPGIFFCDRCRRTFFFQNRCQGTNP